MAFDKTALIGDADKLGKLIDSIKTSAKRLDSNVQLAALSAAMRIEEHGDIGYANRLYTSMGKGARHVALAAWLLGYAGLQANTDKSTKDTKPFIIDKSKKVDLEGGYKTAWFDMKPSKAPDEVLDVLKLALAMLKKAGNPKEGQEVLHGQMIPELQAIVEKYNVAAVTPDGDGGDDSQDQS